MNNFLCLIGIHKPDNNWVLKWSSKKQYCKCKKCNKYIVDGVAGAFNEYEFRKKF